MIGLKDKKVLLFGDSIMFGSGNDGFGVGEYLERDLNIKLFKYCIGGARVGYNEGKSWVIEQVRQAVNDGVEADYVVFDGFTNDCCMTDKIKCDVPLGEMRKGFDGFDIFSVSNENTTFSDCFENILCAIKKYFPNAKYLFIRPHKMGRRDAKQQVIYGERAIDICRKWGVEYVDLYNEIDLDTFDEIQRDKYTADSYGWGKGDCTHPNALCYEEKYMPLIEKKLKKL